VRRLFSRESIDAAQTIRSIRNGFHNEHGVVDVFGRGYPKRDILCAVYALNRLQNAVLVLRQEQEQEQQQQNSSVVAATTLDRQLLRDLAYYVVYANAAYGWKMDLLALRWRFHVGGDVQALLRRTGLRAQDVVVAEWESQTHRPAYLLVRDHAQRSLVLAVRGTVRLIWLLLLSLLSCFVSGYIP